MSETTNLFSWVRKGIGNQITEEDQLGGKNASVKMRPSVQLSLQLKALPVKNGNVVKTTEVKNIDVIGPGDVLSVSSDAVMNCYPPSGHEGLAIGYKPYIEFWEPDFAWRYTPASANTDDNAPNEYSKSKLRPWLAVVACRADQYSITKNSNGVDLVTFNVDESNYENVFPDPKDIWKSAHAQGDVLDDDSPSDVPKPDFCRIICVNGKDFECEKKYTAFVIPVFEVARLRALGLEDDIKDTMVQASAWEKTYREQKEKHPKYPLVFPAYFSWTFKTGVETFKNLVDALSVNRVEKMGIDVDVTNLGDGLFNHSGRKTISMPSAIRISSSNPETVFPNVDDPNETNLARKLREKLEMSPVFQENKRIISGCTSYEEYDSEGNGDPVVVPPIYGGKHAMATSLDNPSWLKTVNLDLHYRAVAGLGKKIVQEHQERFVNRAWKQVELVKALNGKLQKKLLSNKVIKSLKNTRYRKLFKYEDVKVIVEKEEKILEAPLIKKFMMILQSMKSTKFGEKDMVNSLNQILEKRGIPTSFATTVFQNRTQMLASQIEDLNLSSLFGCIAAGRDFRIMNPVNFNYFSLEEIQFLVFKALLDSLFDRNLTAVSWPIFDYLSLEKMPESQYSINPYWSNQTRNLVHAAYKFKLKWNDFSKDSEIFEALGGDRSLARKLLIKSRSDFISKSITSIEDYVKALKNVNQEIKDVLSEFPSYGKHSPFGNNGVSFSSISVIGLKKDIYTSVFKEKIITRVRLGVCLFSFVNRDEIIDEMKRSDDESLIRKYIKLGVVVNNVFVEINDLEKDIIPDVINVNSSAFTNSDFIEKYVNKLDDRLRSLDFGVYDLIRSYFETDKSNNKSKMYKDYANYLDSCRSIGYLYTPTVPKDPDYSELKDLLEYVDNETEKSRSESVDVINRYFETFLKSGKVQQNFIDDCLSSQYPIMAYPQFPEPTYYYLKQLSDKFILPCVDKLPDNSVSMFISDEAFVEAFLCGMNTEMGRELLWREFPTDQRGSYFKKFWDTETSVKDILKAEFFDIRSIHTWKNELGENHNESKSQLLMFAIKGKLMKSYPDTEIYLQEAIIENNEIKPKINGVIKRPESQAFFKDDIYIVGFKIDFAEALGKPDSRNGNGYMLVFKQMMENLNFECVEQHKDNSAEYAKEAIVEPYMCGKHVLTYVTDIN